MPATAALDAVAVDFEVEADADGVMDGADDIEAPEVIDSDDIEELAMGDAMAEEAEPVPPPPTEHPARASRAAMPTAG
ncbi:hypothetical protein BGP79_00045 [Tersicoccus sp. Bi-70]|nr:hypothetical protein BGP79_00045 [Tersicoccus sp. Bi-70]